MSQAAKNRAVSLCSAVLSLQLLGEKTRLRPLCLGGSCEQKQPGEAAVTHLEGMLLSPKAAAVAKVKIYSPELHFGPEAALRKHRFSVLRGGKYLLPRHPVTPVTPRLQKKNKNKKRKKKKVPGNAYLSYTLFFFNLTFCLLHQK